jgi:hypothetical protein
VVGYYRFVIAERGAQRRFHFDQSKLLLHNVSSTRFSWRPMGRRLVGKRC